MVGLKGQTPAVWLVLIMLFMVFAFVAVFAWQQQLLAVRVPVEYEGEWDKIYAPENVGGTDLTITETSITDGATIKAANMSYDINGTDGTTYYMAFGIEISGSNGFEKMDIDGELASGIATTEMQIRKFYVVPDEEGVNLDVSDAIYVGTVSSDQDEFELTVGPVPEGDYVFVVEAKGISTSTIGSGDQLLTIEFDATTDEDVDDFTLYIYNG